MSTITGYDDLTHGQTKALVSKMGGVDTAMAFLRGEYVLTEIAVAVAAALLTCNIDVNRNRSPKDTIIATGRVPYINWEVIATMPVCEGGFSAAFIPVGHEVKFDDLDDTLKELGWELIRDPIGLANLLASDPSFADKHPIATQWKDADGKWCYATFDRWASELRVSVDRNDDNWDGHVVFPCRRKTTSSTATVE